MATILKQSKADYKPSTGETGFAEDDAKTNIINVKPGNILLPLIMAAR